MEKQLTFEENRARVLGNIPQTQEVYKVPFGEQTSTRQVAFVKMPGYLRITLKCQSGKKGRGKYYA